MKERKTIKINANIIKSLIIGLAIGVLSVYVTEHFGSFSFMPDTSGLPPDNSISFQRQIPYDTPIGAIYFTSPFGSKLTFDGKDFTIADMSFSTHDKFKKYSNKMTYYWMATWEDIKYVLLIGLILAVLTYFPMNYRISLS